MMGKIHRPLLLVFVLANVLPTIALADNSHAQNQNNLYIVAPTSLPGCAAGTVSICGKNLSYPPLPAYQNLDLQLPSIFVHSDIIIQCLPVAITSAASMIALPNYIDCTLDTCPAGTVTICGHDIDIPAGTAVTDSTDISVPAATLGQPPSYQGPSFSVRCVEQADRLSLP